MVKNDCAHTTTEMADYMHTSKHTFFRTSKCIPTPTPWIGVNVPTSLSSPQKSVTALSHLLCRGQCALVQSLCWREWLHIQWLCRGGGTTLGSWANYFQPIPAHSAHSSPLQPIPHHPNLFPAYSGHPLIPTYSSPYHPSHNPSPSQPISSQFQTTLLIPPHPTAERLDGSKGVGRFISQPRRQDRSKNWLQQADWDNAMMLGWWEQQGARSTKNSRVEWVHVEQAGTGGAHWGWGKSTG